MAMYCPECDRQIHVASLLVRKDHRQRWVYYAGNNVYSISETPVPFKEAVSVYWMPIHGMVSYSYRPAALAHSAV